MSDIKYKVSPQEYSDKWFNWRMKNGVVGEYSNMAFQFSDRNVSAFIKETYPGIDTVWFDQENVVINMR